METAQPIESDSLPKNPTDDALRDDEFWRALPAYADVAPRTFFDHNWQAKHSVSTPEEVLALVEGFIEPNRRQAFRDGLIGGMRSAPMSVRLPPYLIALIDWDAFATDPLRRQYLVLRDELVPDHPKLQLDPLQERRDSPVSGITHRHRNAVLFLAVEICPVYCRYCTRSYLVGRDTELVTKDRLTQGRSRWKAGLEYVAAHPEVEDVVLSGGDAYLLSPEDILALGGALLDIPHVRRVRFATKGPAVAPMKLFSHPEWTQALATLVERGRRMHKQVCLHTHFSHPREITDVTRLGLERLFELGITTRNQAVLLRGVNDDASTLRSLVRKLALLNVQSYYVYQQDMVPGVEDLRTALHTAIELEKQVRGSAAGFQTPLFIVDVAGGGGKRDVHSYESYDRVTGISVYRSPNLDERARYLNFDPLDTLPYEGRERWSRVEEHAAMVREALAGAC